MDYDENLRDMKRTGQITGRAAAGVVKESECKIRI